MSETKRYIYVVREDWHGIICVPETIYSDLLWAIQHNYLADIIIKDNEKDLTVRQIIEKKANRVLTDEELAKYITEMDDRDIFLNCILYLEQVELVQ